MAPYQVSTRAQVLALVVAGLPAAQIQEWTGVCHSTQNRIYNRALDRGFDPKKPLILDKYVVDGLRSGRPRKKVEGGDGETGDRDDKTSAPPAIAAKKSQNGTSSGAADTASAGSQPAVPQPIMSLPAHKTPKLPVEAETPIARMLVEDARRRLGLPLKPARRD